MAISHLPCPNILDCNGMATVAPGDFSSFLVSHPCFVQPLLLTFCCWCPTHLPLNILGSLWKMALEHWRGASSPRLDWHQTKSDVLFSELFSSFFEHPVIFLLSKLNWSFAQLSAVMMRALCELLVKAQRNATNIPHFNHKYALHLTSHFCQIHSYTLRTFFEYPIWPSCLYLQNCSSWILKGIWKYWRK